jgi:hypothetical protein
MAATIWESLTRRMPAKRTDGMRPETTSRRNMWYGMPVDQAAAAIGTKGSATEVLPVEL